MPQPPAREREEPPITRAIEQHLRDRQTDQFGVCDLAWSARPTTGQEEVIGQDVKSDEERVEADGHEASKVDDARTPPVFDTSIAPPRRHPINSESII